MTIHIHEIDDQGNCSCGFNINYLDVIEMVDADVIEADKFSWTDPSEITWLPSG